MRAWEVSDKGYYQLWSGGPACSEQNAHKWVQSSEGQRLGLVDMEMCRAQNINLRSKDLRKETVQTPPPHPTTSTQTQQKSPWASEQHLLMTTKYSVISNNKQGHNNNNKRSPDIFGKFVVGLYISWNLNLLFLLFKSKNSKQANYLSSMNFSYCLIYRFGTSQKIRQHGHL